MTASNSIKPLYVQFIDQVRAAIRAEGLPEPTAAETPSGLPENEGYCFIEWGAHGSAPAMIVPKSKTRMGNLHSHVDLSGHQGHIQLPKRNGRVVCHFAPDVALVSRALHAFMGASKRDVAAPVRRLPGASQSTSATASGPASQAPKGPTAGDLEIASWEGTREQQDAEAEEALQYLSHA